MKTIPQIKKNIEYFVRGKKAILLLTADNGSSLLINIVREMKMRSVFVDTGYHFSEIVSHIEEVKNNIDCVQNHDATAEEGRRPEVISVLSECRMFDSPFYSRRKEVRR